MRTTRNLFHLGLAIILLLSCIACGSTAEKSSLSPPENPALETLADSTGNPAEIEALQPTVPDPGEPASSQDETEADQNKAQEGNGDAAEPAPAPTGNSGNNGAALVQSSEPVVLTIKGNGVNSETTWTLSQLQALSAGYRELTYSTTNNWPSYGHLSAQGVSLPYLLQQAGLKNGAASFKFSATDGYSAFLTYQQIFSTHYSYANHSPAGSSGASAIEPLIAWAWGDAGKVRAENIRSFFGQRGSWDVNTAASVQDLCMIEVSTASVGSWPAPGASIAGGSTVATGTGLEILHSHMDSVRIYYTLDGNEPDYNSQVYNPSTSYFQPQLIKPLVLTESVTIKAFAAAFGKDRSPTASFSYTVE